MSPIKKLSLSFSLNTLYRFLFIFYIKTAVPLKKVTPFSQQIPPKNWGTVKTLHTSSRKGMVHTMTNQQSNFLLISNIFLMYNFELICPTVVETIFSWLSMVTHGYFMVMPFDSIPMVKNGTTVQWKRSKSLS